MTSAPIPPTAARGILARDLDDNSAMTDHEGTSSFSFAGESGPELVAFWSGGGTSCAVAQGTSVVVGRSAEADLRIDHPSVSRAHARVHATPAGGFELEDLGSANGTRLHGEALPSKARVVLEPGAIAELGAAMIVLKAGTDVPSLAGAPTHPPSTATEALDRLISLVAQGAIPVILTGETGVGKELWAHRIHARSPRAARPWVPINCAAIPEALVESELFGHERGAFTGANNQRIGLIEHAADGTVFLDEVTDLPPRVQAKLLRVLECREVYRLGSSKSHPIGARFVSATNQDVRALVASGAFRADLYYRLNGLTLEIPPLRERRAEIPDLARLFAQEAASSLGKAPSTISRAAMHWLQSQAWPGNIRELKNRIECACLLCENGVIEIRHLEPGARNPSQPASTDGPAGPASLWKETERLERERIFHALEVCQGNQTKAARMLRISRRTLINRLDDYRVERPRRKK